MPYSNPEDKRRWEREHRQQRNDKRRIRRSGSDTAITILRPMPDPTVSGGLESAGIAIAVGIIVLAVGMLLVAIVILKLRKRRADLITNARPTNSKGGSK